MAKKRALPIREPAEELDSRERIVKIRLSEDEMRTLRVAAALEDMPAASFARSVVMERAAALLRQHGMGSNLGKE